ncbi:MAG: phasin family protein [Proteobacteria bacterium]|nr:phasin family protein [Pseudomonadota bacterium]
MTEAFEKWSDMAKKLQAPFQAIAELNVKTIQSLTYLKPDDLAKIKKPEDLLEKQLGIAVDNGHKALDYVQNSFRIFEKAIYDMVEETKTRH